MNNHNEKTGTKADDIKKESGKEAVAKLTKEAVINMAWCLGLALFWVVFIWGIWQRGVFALGANAFVFFAFALALFIRVLYRRRHYQKRDLAWIVPLCLIALSYLIYDNPFLKAVNMLVYPALGAVFINYGFLKDKDKKHWDLDFVLHLIGRIFSFLAKIGEALNSYIDLLVPKAKRSRGTVRKTIVGIILFLVIAFTVIIPLLSAADSIFAARVDIFFGWFKNLFSEIIVYKIGVFMILSVGLFAALLAWGRSHDYKEKDETTKKIDPIVSGIVLGGILALYLLFLWVQLERLWVGSLPFEFKETENLVKSGFWQLFFLTGLNTLVYFFTYRKTNRVVQRILAAFTVASLFLLVSAGHRLALYVGYYGFSYEKFFASYTVIYSAVLFGWLISRLYAKERANIFKFLVMLFLWMYAVITVFPVEQFILRANVALSGIENSRIRLFELTMLSPDVLGAVKKYSSAGLLKENAGYLERENSDNSNDEFDWQPWIDQQEKRLSDKKWYERNIMNLFGD